MTVAPLWPVDLPPAPKPAPNGDDSNGDAWTFPDPEIIRDKLSFRGWLERDIKPPDRLMGEWLTTTSRVLLIGPTGLGKTNIGLATAAFAAEGHDFLHWRGSGKPRRVLYVDGEMPERLMHSRARLRNDDGRRPGFDPLVASPRPMTGSYWGAVPRCVAAQGLTGRELSVLIVIASHARKPRSEPSPDGVIETRIAWIGGGTERIAVRQVRRDPGWFSSPAMFEACKRLVEPWRKRLRGVAQMEAERARRQREAVERAAEAIAAVHRDYGFQLSPDSATTTLLRMQRADLALRDGLLWFLT